MLWTLSEPDLMCALETEHLSRFVRRRDFERKLVQDADDLGDEIGIDFASSPLPRKMLSSSPTRTLPPMIAPMVTRFNWWRPAPRIDQM